MVTNYDFLNSLDSSQLTSLLKLHPSTASLIESPAMTEAEADKARKEKKRLALRDIKIPCPKDPKRRNELLADTPSFLRYYFESIFYEPFTSSRLQQIEAIEKAAIYGGDQAVADSRGEGKTTTAMHVALVLMLKGLSNFPIVIGKSQAKSQMELAGIKDSLQFNERLLEDFPEVCVPLQAVGGWSSRARMQTVNGVNTNLRLAADHLIFPTIKESDFPDTWPKNCKPCSNGQIISCMGVDGPIRGTKILNKRPTIAIIDDMEDRESANSETLIKKNVEIIEQDIGGLGASDQRIPRVLLCTIQNRKCVAYTYTDPVLKPSWRGKRFRKMIKPPSRMDLVQQYISMRQERKADDPDAREAFNFWKDNQEKIESDCVISNPYSFSKKPHSDGQPLELSAIQSYYNRVADVGQKAVSTEIDNDPPEEAGPQGSGLTAEIVANRISGLSRFQLPANTRALTAAIDLGKYRCHWVVTAWWPGAGGVVVDYGVAEVTGTDKTMDNEASQPMIYRALLNWRDELLNKNYTDATGTIRKVDFCLVDSGAFTDAAYGFCREVRGIFKPSKGLNPYHPRKQSTETCKAGANLHAQYFDTEKLWLYELDTEHWKQWVHERFLTPTYDETNMLRRGSLSLYSPDGNQKHSSYAQHIVAEEMVTEFKEGKGTKTRWYPKNDNNHWLDATYMAAAASEVFDIKLVGQSEVEVTPRHVDKDNPKPKPKPAAQQHGRFRQRPGGGHWIPKRRN
jgi:Phage terminase large subunit (GpA)